MSKGVVATVAALTVLAGCGKWADDLACGDQGCGWTGDEWTRIRGLAFICSDEQRSAGAPCGTPVPPDRSNRYLPIADWDTGALKPDPGADPVVALGRRFYFEPLLSGSATWNDTLGRHTPSARAPVGEPTKLSCASCHDPARYGGDFTSVPRTISIGAGWYDVNGQQTLNAARFPLLYWNGRADSLWAQAAQVMESAVSMNGHRMKTFWVIANHYRDAYAVFPEAPPEEPPKEPSTDPAPAAPPTWAALAATLQAPPEATATTDDYRKQFAALSPAEQRTVTFVHVNVAKAIAAYEWLLSSDHSPFDQFVNEGPQSTALPPAAQRGLKLFIGKASCIDCHNTPLLSDGKFHDIGIGQSGAGVPTVADCSDLPSAPKCDCVSGKTCLPWGAYYGMQKLASQEFSRRSKYSDDAAAPLSQTPAPMPMPDEQLKGTWRTPSLRDVAMTGPYMHDGILATLSDVVWHYDQADGIGAAHAARSNSQMGDLQIPSLGSIGSLRLSADEREDLVAFLFSLTGTSPGVPLLAAPPGQSGEQRAQ
ncbi:MAG: cytochrome c peroxidase [Myxococcales bacterium]